MPDEHRDVIEVLEHDHREVSRCSANRVAVGPVASLMDRMRDAITGRGNGD